MPFALLLAASLAPAQTAWDPNAIAYAGPSSWQQAAVAALNRHLPTDSGYWVLGPLDLAVDLSDSTDLVRSTLRIIAPDPSGSRSVTRRLWVPTGGVALEELQPSDTLLPPLPPGYPGRLVKGNVAGQATFIQVFTVQEHRWLLWAERTRVSAIKQQTGGAVARYSSAVTAYLAAVDSGRPTSGPPPARVYGLDQIFDFYAPPPDPVIRDRQGFLDLLARNREFSLAEAVRDVYGFIPGPELTTWLEEKAEDVLYPNKDSEVALQRRYREFRDRGGRWIGYPLLSGNTLTQLEPGRYLYAADRYGFVRIAKAADPGSTAGLVTAAILAHGDPVRAAGEMVLAREPDGLLRVAELNIRAEDYFFSNRALSLYTDVEERSDRYVFALGHVVKGLEVARVPLQRILIRKF